MDSGRSFESKWPVIRGLSISTEQERPVSAQTTVQFSAWRSPIFEFLDRLKSYASQKDIKLLLIGRFHSAILNLFEMH